MTLSAAITDLPRDGVERRPATTAHRRILSLAGALLATILVGLVSLVGAQASEAAFRSPWPSVRCADTPGLLAAGASGVYHTADRTIDLRLYVCAGLAKAQRGVVSDLSYLSLLTLSHELSHASKISDEQAAEAHALLIMPSVGRRIGVPAGALAELLTWRPK